MKVIVDTIFGFEFNQGITQKMDFFQTIFWIHWKTLSSNYNQEWIYDISELMFNENKKQTHSALSIEL